MIELAIVLFGIAALSTFMWVLERLGGSDLTEADRDTMCYRCGARGWPKHVHVSER